VSGLAEGGRMSTAEAIHRLRADPEQADLIRDSYLGEDTRAAADSFARSAEFAEVMNLVGDRVRGGTVLDVGAGTGIASFAFERAGARPVWALEPDPSPVVGRAAMQRLGLRGVEVLDGVGERIPLPDGSVDLVYSRQVLHHVSDITTLAKEVHRVLSPGGMYLACREHVIEREEDLDTFLANHEVHQLAGGERAHQVETYLDAIRAGGLRVRRVWRPLDSVINAFPLVRSNEELADLRASLLGPPLGRLAPGWPERLPLIRRSVQRRLAPYMPPGSMWSFLAERRRRLRG
jgi:SAM-dependent methyltransferase